MTLPLFPSGPVDPNAKPPATLRIYQQQALGRIRSHIIAGRKRILCVAPTGAGKTKIMSAIIRTATVPILFAAHRKELLDNCVEQLAEQGITNVSVIRGDDERYNPSASIHVASVMSLARRDKPEAGIVFIDEAHRAAAPQYVEHLFKHYSQAIILGFTATPCRTDGQPLGGDLFEHLEVIVTYDTLLKNPNWLVAPEIYSTPIKADLSSVQVNADYNETQLADVMGQRELVGNVVTHWKKHANRYAQGGPGQFTVGDYRRTLVFCVDIRHSKKVCEEFRRSGIKAAHLDGETASGERRQILADLESGVLTVLCSVDIAIEGIDIPAIKCIVHCRPTKSMVVWRQGIGREMRPWNGVKPILLDHAGNFDEHGSPFEDLAWSLSTRPKRLSGGSTMKLCKVCFAYVELSRHVCVHCGAFFTTVERELPKESDAELLERSLDPNDLRMQWFTKHVSIARTQGFRPGFASAKYKERYGDWPPRAWSDKIKTDFETDELWKSLLERRLERKRERDAQEEREKQELQAMTDEKLREIEPEQEGQDPWGLDPANQDVGTEFSDWLNDEGVR